jgi:WD40 repeat protein
MDAFADRLREAGPDAVGFFYYSGHGGSAEREGKRANYIIPVGEPIEFADDLESFAVPLPDRVSRLQRTGAGAVFVVIDACRNTLTWKNTMGGAVTKGVRRDDFDPTGKMLLFAAGDGDFADDDPVFSTILAEEISRPGQDSLRAFANVSQRVGDAKPGKTPPVLMPGLRRDVCFVSCVEAIDLDTDAWARAQLMNTHASYDSYLTFYPRGRFALQAREALTKLGPEPLQLGTRSGNWEVERSFEGHANRVTVAAWSPEGARVLTASDDGTARIWDVATGRELINLPVGGIVASATWDQLGAQVVTGNWNGVVQVWDALTGVPRPPIKAHDGAILSVTWGADGKYLLSHSWDGTAKVWDSKFGKLISDSFLEVILSRRYATSKTKINDEHGDSGHGNDVCSANFEFNGPRLLIASANKTVLIWDISTNKLVSPIRASGHTVSAVAWISDGSRVLTGGSSGATLVWDASTGKLLLPLGGHEGGVVSAAWSPDGSQIATASTDGTGRIWDSSSGRLLAILFGHVGELRSISWDQNGSRILTVGVDGTARVWFAKTGLLLVTLPLQNRKYSRVLNASWSPDGTRIVTAFEDGSVNVWVEQTLAAK